MSSKLFITAVILSWLFAVGCEKSGISTSLPVDDLPQITSVEPDSGAFDTPVTIKGDQFAGFADRIRVRFNDMEAKINDIKDKEIKVLVPKGSRSGPITITVDDQTVTGPDFTYLLTVTVATEAGSGVEGYLDAGSDEARFNQPWGIEVSENGKVFIADFQNSAIREIGNDESVSTFAAFPLDHPMGIALGIDGKLYVADAFNNIIRSISLNGEMERFAGSGAIGAQDGDKLEASFNLPADVAIRRSNLAIYVADGFNNKIREINPAGVVRTLAGSREGGYRDGNGASARFLRPGGLALSPDESTLYVADFLNHVIRVIDLATGNVRTLAGNGEAGFKDGPLDEARFFRPFGITVDSRGIIYVADSGNHRIRMIKNNEVVTIAGDGTAGFKDGSGSSAQFNEPYHIVITRIGGSVMYVADRRNNRVRRITLE